MIATSDFRKGVTKILWKDEPWLVLDYTSVKPGKGGAYIRTKMKNLITGRLLEETFRSGEKLPDAGLEQSKMQFLYESDGLYNFMDQETYEQVEFSKDQMEQVLDYLKEEVIYNVLIFNEKPISVEPPIFMILKIASTVPGVKGDTAQGGNKPAVLETGLKVNVPLFVNEGDTIKVDTRDGKYMERADSESK